jgi:molybdopterin/thiamine biosynthesis adenylyltransferase
MKRFDRQILLFGKEGQEKIASRTVAVSGLGGLGSHVVQQLAYLGVRAFLLVDHDHVVDTNLNRLVGATAADAAAKTPKVDVAERLIHSIDPEAVVDKVVDSIASADTCRRLQEVDFVIGCVDHDGPRLVLTMAAAAYCKPYFDVATDIKTEETPIVYGGRVFFARGGEGCLHCLDYMDDRAIRIWASSPESLAAEDRIYGERRAGPSPSVVTLNGVLASVATTEFMVEVTGLRPAHRYLEYRGNTGRMTIDDSAPTRWCAYCDSFRGPSTEHLDRLLEELPQGIR